jgi:flagellar hook-length control protein FliK
LPVADVAQAPQAADPAKAAAPAPAPAPAPQQQLPGNQSDAGSGNQPQPQAAPQVAPTTPAPADKPTADAPSTAAQPAHTTGDKPAEATAADAAPAPTTDAAGTQTPVAQAAQPVAVTTAGPQATRYEPAAGMRLHQAVETVQAVIRMAQSNGVTRARVALHPEQLGGLEIHLRSTPDGIVAKVVADAAQAANVLRHAGEELRRSLESQGLNLVSFDVGTAGGQGERSSSSGQGESGTNGRNPFGSVDDTEAPADTTQETTVRLPNGVLIDVLA